MLLTPRGRTLLLIGGLLAQAWGLRRARRVADQHALAVVVAGPW